MLKKLNEDATKRGEVGRVEITADALRGEEPHFVLMTKKNIKRVVNNSIAQLVKNQGNGCRVMAHELSGSLEGRTVGPETKCAIDNIGLVARHSNFSNNGHRDRRKVKE